MLITPIINGPLQVNLAVEKKMFDGFWCLVMFDATLNQEIYSGFVLVGIVSLSQHTS